MAVAYIMEGGLGQGGECPFASVWPSEFEGDKFSEVGKIIVAGFACIN